MKNFTILLLLLISINLKAQTPSVPFYLGLPEYSHLPLNDNNWIKVPIANIGTDFDSSTDTIIDTDKVYLRGYLFNDYSISGRKNAFKELYDKEIIKPGDVILSFRPSWANTTPYAHFQMGVSHAGLAYLYSRESNPKGEIRNVDMPLTPEYLNTNFDSVFTSEHYLDAPMTHILRPRNFNDQKQENFQQWMNVLRVNYDNIVKNGLLIFNKDYSSPKINQYPEGEVFITKMARIILGEDTTSVDLTLFCSEFVWAMLSLSNCSPYNHEFYDPKITKVSCIKPIFSAMSLMNSDNVPGLTSAPYYILKALDLSDQETKNLMESLFVQKADISSLSSGHRNMSNNPNIIKLIETLRKVYPKMLRADNDLENIFKKINASDGRNYSPTSFLINTMLDDQNPERAFDYVATIVFTGRPDQTKEEPKFNIRHPKILPIPDHK